MFHIVGIGPIGSLLAFHLRRSIPKSMPITLIVKTKVRAAELRSLGGVVIESNGSPITQQGFDIEIFDPLEEIVSEMVFDPHGKPQRPRPYLAIKDGKGIAVEAKSIDSASQPIKSLFVCTKAYSTISVLRRLKRRITPETTIVLLQNGMGVYDQVVGDLFGSPTERPQFVLGTTTHAARTKTYGKLFHTIHVSSGELAFGIVPDPTGRRDFERSKFDENIPPQRRTLSLNDVGPSYRETGFSERYSNLRDTIAALANLRALYPIWEPMSDLQTRMKRKLVVNSIINPMTALAQCSNGSLFGHDATQYFIRAVCDEVEALFTKEEMLAKDVPPGVMPVVMNDHEENITSSVPTSVVAPVSQRDAPANISPPEKMYTLPRGLRSRELQDEVYRVMRRTSLNYSSMFVDILKGRPTEIEHLNGYIRRLGVAYGVPTPHNDTLYNLIKLREVIAPVVRI